MRSHYEILKFTTYMPVRCTLHRLGHMEGHLHDFFEIVLILSGQCKAIVGGQSFTLGQDDLLAVNGHTAHSFHGSDCVLISVQFEQSLFEKTLPEPQHPTFLCNTALQNSSIAHDNVRRLIALLVKNNADQQTGYPLRNWSLIYQLMDVFYNNFRADGSHAQNVRAHRYAARIAQITESINAHYTENYTLSALADEVHLSAPYLSKFFDQHFGISFLAYLTQIRLSHAVDELIQTDDTIETVSANSGFPNSHAFVQAFRKEYDQLPSVYRRQSRIKEKAPEPFAVPEQHDYMAGLKKYLDTNEKQKDSSQQTIACNARCDAKAIGQQLQHTWRNCMAVSNAHDLLFADVQNMVRRTQREVGFRFIKFNGILSDEMHVYSRNGSGGAVYSFTHVDKVLDFLRSVGLRPLIQLSFMPTELAADPQRRLFNYLVSEPASNKEWADLVTALVQHLLTRYGQKEVRQWMFSVWNQPDTPHNMYGFSTSEAFYEFYRCTHRALKNCDPALCVGAPSNFYILEKGYENWYIPFIRWCQNHNCLPDFLNFHYYDTVQMESERSGQELFGFVGSMTLSENPDGFNHFVDQVNSEGRALFPQGIPIYLTEWNNTPSHQDLLNDTCFKSCYIIKGILENYDRLSSFAYWSLTDWMSEAPLPAELFSGGLGLFTKNGLAKASYYALPMLRQLGDTLIGKGPGWFATRQGEGYRIILYNYRHFSHLYALGERFDMTFTERYTPFSPEQTLDVHLTLDNVASSDYLVREVIVNRRFGSAFDLWNAMGALELEQPWEVENLASRSQPALNRYLIKAQDNALELDVLLEMLEVRLIMIEPA